MAITTVTVTGELRDIAGAPQNLSLIRFTPRGWDKSGAAIITGAPVDVTVTGGTFSASLFQQSLGQGVIYDVAYVLKGDRTTVIGSIFIDGPGPYALADLLGVPVPHGVTVTLVDEANWPPPADPNPLHWYARVT
ncbi:hypothetical protein [Ketogulonicigenium vulgare]|uniref:Uncharacterized protein n=1 Tax=Ketogulonicigenium vulgare (strain WSH-001) TaxID=759362 RepID=F9Y4M4_KETVW|nr:hypothetical protein [Ketogulonicigenium vulgare]ADO42385.1 hypothetical protein EIO_1242 [Ketogulonicigenium vulgare Y25]AEM40581.1 hypothetical protein KVU_0742 [Ketogulonicigenium vulgare WSH-001]ALJ80763.1 hypothetical protein KVH_05945 [Ketogulonicigenium vulgare]ANW33554.1 hypothetical protein KvSKV_05915 [Ketogulonicigenium vulgare]AOZ54297.1 hypothetical protein KVC_1280 [Ketogulonicigenium vulgare]